MITTRQQMNKRLHDAPMSELTTTGELAQWLVGQITEVAPAWAAHQPDLTRRITTALAAEVDELLLPPMSYDEFLEWATQSDDDHKHAEWIDGKVIRMTPASRRHQQIVMFLSRLLYDAVYRQELGELFSAPFQMQLTQVASGREPDLLFVATENLHRVRDTHLRGPADLVIEVISPESAQRDREVKYAEYETAGVREYWIIDPDQGQCDFFVLDPSGSYTQAASGRTGTHTSTVIPALTVHLEWFGQDPLPPVWELLQP